MTTVHAQDHNKSLQPFCTGYLCTGCLLVFSSEVVVEGVSVVVEGVSIVFACHGNFFVRLVSVSLVPKRIHRQGGQRLR